MGWSQSITQQGGSNTYKLQEVVSIKQLKDTCQYSLVFFETSEKGINLLLSQQYGQVFGIPSEL
jgi:hypothetical protein